MSSTSPPSCSVESDATEWGFATRCLHAGVLPDPHSGAVMTPISLSTTFAQHSPGQPFPGGFEYSRASNPTRQAFEQCVASLEGAQYALAFASGLAATTTIYHLLKPGDEILSVDDVYGGTGRYFRAAGGPLTGIKCSQIDLTDATQLLPALTPNTRLLWLETPTNPTLKVVDIAALAQVARAQGVLVVVDNTFCSPYYQNPLALGADIVVHSVTKYLNGHSDAVMGAVALNDEELYRRMKFLQNAVGAIPSPFDCYLALRGVKTLPVRMRQHSLNAMAVAEFLQAHPKVAKTLYPGLPSHPQHELAKRQMRGFGGMVSFVLRADLDGVRRFLENLKVFTLAESLGGVESLANHPAIMTHASVPQALKDQLGITDGLVRLSVGIEDEKDLIHDLTQALSKV